MKQPWLELTDPATIELLLSENALATLAPFFDRARSLSEAAALIGWKLPRLTAWVNKLLELNVLVVERIERRKGSSLKYYRTAAPVFYLPYNKLGAEYFDAFREEMRVNLEYRLGQGLKKVVVKRVELGATKSKGIHWAVRVSKKCVVLVKSTL